MIYNQQALVPSAVGYENRKSHGEDIYLSVVVPVFNEKENTTPLADEVAAALSGLERPWELIFIDDGSIDGTAEQIDKLAGERFWIKALHHVENAGQSAAVASGFAFASGEWVGTLDGDGQNDPADLLLLLRRCQEEEADCVTGIRAERRDTWLRRFSSRTANSFRNFLTGDRLVDSGCGIRIMRREGLHEVPVFNGMHRFLPTLMRAQGFVVAEQTVNHRQRTRGVSKYGIGNRLWRGIRDCFGVRWYLARAVPARRVKAKTGK